MRYANTELHNVCDVVTDDNQPGTGLLRLPRAILERINPGARRMAAMTAGCEIRAMLPEDGQMTLVLQAMDTNTTPAIATVYHGCFCSQSVLVKMEPGEIQISRPAQMDLISRISDRYELPFDPRLVRIRLPLIHTIRILSMEGDHDYPETGTTPAETMLCYGSSITQGACALTPEGNYVSQCARRLGCDLINLGSGGSAQMDLSVAEHIAGRDDWDFAVLEMGINVRTWPLEQFHAATERFVKTIVAAHPDKYVFCLDMFTCDVDFEEIPSKGVGFRETVKEIASACRSEKVVHVDGRSILTSPSGLRTDLVHPADDAMQEMGMNLASVVRQTRTGAPK